MKEFSKEIRAYALKNAIEHGGKAVAGAVINGLFRHGLKKEDVKKVMPEVVKGMKEVNSMNLENQKKEFSQFEKLVGHREEREGLAELPNVGKKGVVMRFCPSPSGPLHIGHAITGMYSSLYVKKYGGKFYIRIEDTNPENIYLPAYKMIPAECDWLFGNVTKYIIQSDRMKIYYKYAEKLIKSGNAYVCTCDSEKFKALVDKMKPCPCRGNDKKKNLARWKKMLDKKGYKDEEAVVRFKSDLNNPNPAFRDFPLARINTAKHPRVGNKYKVWPLMNLAVSVDDIKFGTTHAIRGKDHKDNAVRQNMIYHALGEKKVPVALFMGRINFSDMELSTTKTRKAIESGKYSGWDDARLPFIASLKKRGYLPKAFELMTIQRGLSEADKVISQKDFYSLLDNFNKEAKKEMG